MAAIAAEHGLSAERVRQLVRRVDGGGGTTRRRRRQGGEGELVRLRIGNLAKAVLVTGQAYQDPKDALNEFVSNAADDYAEAGLVDGRIRIMLRRKGARPVIAVDDNGRGMAPDRLREVARNLFESAKLGDDRTLGEKAIGLLAFQQLGGRCEIVSRAAGSDETWMLRLRRGDAAAELVRERRRSRATSGTTVYITDLDAEATRVLTQRKVVDYLRRRGAAIADGSYTLEVVEGRTGELVTPDESAGLPSRSRPTTRCGHVGVRPLRRRGRRSVTARRRRWSGRHDDHRRPRRAGRVRPRPVDQRASVVPRHLRAAAPVGRATGHRARRRGVPRVP